MPQSSKFSIKGLHTSNSDISGVPEGSLSIAKNLDLSKLNLALSRRGFDQLGTGLPDAGYRATKLFDYNGYIFGYYNTSLNYYNAGWNANGSLVKPANAIVPRHVALNQNLYISSSTGLKKLDAFNSTLYSAGIPGGLMMELTASAATGTAVGSSTFGQRVAYRYFIGRYDANNNFIRGGVSGREIFTNLSGATKNVSIKGYIPTSINNSYIIQVYRSEEFTNPSASKTNDVDDELKLCYEMPVTSNMFSTYSQAIVSIDLATEIITSTAHGFTNGTIVRFTTTNTLPASITLLQDYYIVGATTNTYQISATFGGTAVNITGAGTGTHTASGVDAFSFQDITPNDLIGTTIYIAASQQGIVNDNAEPPLAADIAVYKNFIFYADVESKHRYNFTLISVSDGSAGVLASGNTITVGSEVYTANSSAAVISTKTFKVDIASASVAVRIDNTIRSLISVINQGSSLYYAYLNTSSDDDLPGKIRIESRTLGGSAFTVTSNNQTAFNPQLATTAGISQTSKSDAFRNGLMFSKQSEGEAVPIKNQIRVGNSDDPIKRILPLRDSLLIFKARDGVYILRGENESSFNIQLLDSTAKIVAPESLVVLNSQVYGLFEAGICTVSDTSVDIISDPIKDKIQILYGQALQQVKDYSFGVAYETDGKYILSLPQTAGDTYSTYQLVYHVFNDNFWEWDLAVSCGYVSSTDGKLYLGAGANNRILKEFKTYTYSDFTDYEQSCTLSSYVTTSLVISGTSTMSVGDLISQAGAEQPAYITSVDATTNTITIDIDQAWDTGLPVLHYKAIVCEIEWNPDFAGNPAGFKHYSSCNLLFNRNIVQTATLSFSSDSNPGVNTIVISGPDAVGAWGYVAWDDGVWGGESAPAPVRVGVPKGNARCNSLTVKFTHIVASSDWQLSGLSLDFNPTSTRTAR